MDCGVLFVYGSLKRGCELHHHLARLGARFMAGAKVAAERTNRGRYPGAHPTTRTGKWVRGELFGLRRPARDLRVLDQVEGFVPSAPQRCAFVRARAGIILNSGVRRYAWIYWRAVPRSTGGLHG